MADLNDDAYVADLLAKDARDSSLRYSALGLGALLPKRSTKAAPKPNTRFLRNVIRETDNHNAALRKKEELEARMRLKGIPLAESRSGQDNLRHRGLKRERDDFSRHDDYRRHSSKRVRSDSHDPHPPGYSNGERRRHFPDNFESDDSEHYHKPSPTRKKRGRKHHREHEDDFRSRSRSRSLDRRAERRRSKSDRHSYYHHHSNENQRRRKRYMSRSKSVRSSSSSSSRSRSRSFRHSSQRQDGNISKHGPDEAGPNLPISSRSSTSDPLESIVGPLPAAPAKSSGPQERRPITSRGRGAYRTSTSAMDSHFNSSYDPSLDLHPESEADGEKEDLDMALEALKDREIWKRKGAERLRAAGFGEDEVKKWENSGRGKGAEDVKWASKGDKREWDIGKVILDEPGRTKGEVGVEAAWKRGFLKDLKKALR